jgi:hypothetical protein
MKVTFDPEKRAKTLAERGLDFAHAGAVIDGPSLTIPDDRINYGEERFITVGKMDGRLVVVVWTPRPNARRIISLRKANEREQRLYAPRLE